MILQKSVSGNYLMSKTKTSTVFNIIGNGTMIYIQNFFALSAPVVAPVFGVLLACALMILPIWVLPQFYPTWAESLPILKEFYVGIIVILITLLPGLILFKLAFWNYMLKIVSLNVMVGEILKRKLLKHHTQYTKVVELRSKDYLLMLLIWCLIILMGLALPWGIFLFDIMPDLLPYMLIGFEFLAIFLLVILSIYLSLSFQVFGFETSFGPMQTLEESFKLVLNNFWRLLTLLIVLTIITNLVVPQIIVFLADMLMLKTTLALPFEGLLKNIFENYTGLYDTMQTMPIFAYESEQKFILETSKFFSVSLISTLVSLLMLPLGACYYTLFYFDAKKRLPVKTEGQEEDKSSKGKGKTKKSSKKKNV